MSKDYLEIPCSLMNDPNLRPHYKFIFILILQLVSWNQDDFSIPGGNEALELNQICISIHELHQEAQRSGVTLNQVRIAVRLLSKHKFISISPVRTSYALNKKHKQHQKLLISIIHEETRCRINIDEDICDLNHRQTPFWSRNV